MASPPEAAPPAPEPCANCQAPLQGPFCSGCGQEARHSARSLRTLLHEVFESLTSLDGRVWRTLKALLFRPGLLTNEYLADRRARYLPPFRLYLVISVLFFAIGSSISDVKPPVLPQEPAARAEAATKLAERKQACDELNVSGFGGQRLRAVLVGTCHRAAADNGYGLLTAFAETIPKTMFVFLPIVALVLLWLFGRSRRFYVEHLVFTLHLQSALFVLFQVSIWLDSIDGGRWGKLEPIEDALYAAVVGYMFFYMYRALAVVYGESRPRTIVKLMGFLAGYGVLLALTLAGAAILSVF
jgi:hypothetical protein